MEKVSISLRLDVERNDAQKMITWLKDQEVTKYLNEDPLAAMSLEEIIQDNQSDFLTCYLNRDGRFFLVDSQDEKCIGFINLFTVQSKKIYEIVIAIGDPCNWGKMYGHLAIEQLLYEVFFNWRIEKLRAQIHPSNTRSVNMFKNLNFKLIDETSHYHKYEITFDDYIKYLSMKREQKA